jgi:hypothetical protein
LLGVLSTGDDEADGRFFVRRVKLNYVINM